MKDEVELNKENEQAEKLKDIDLEEVLYADDMSREEDWEYEPEETEAWTAVV